MTYNQIVTEVETILTSHAMIKDVRFATPVEWLAWESEPVLPVALYYIDQGNFNIGRELTFSVQFWFLDKSGVEGEFETEVTSDQHQIAGDIINLMRQKISYSIDDQIVWNALSEKFEDYLSGVTLTFTISTTGEFGACDVPTN
jgi:hypothetical protein